MIRNSKKIYKVLTVFFILVTITLLGALRPKFLVAEISLEDNNNNRNYVTMSTGDLVVPTKEDIMSDGYPTNEKGQTYGPDMGNLMSEEPDLILAEGENDVLGYMLPPKGISSPSELDEYNKSNKKWTLLYLQDGKTVVGKFYFN